MFHLRKTLKFVLLYFDALCNKHLSHKIFMQQIAYRSSVPNDNQRNAASCRVQYKPFHMVKHSLSYHSEIASSRLQHPHVFRYDTGPSVSNLKQKEIKEFTF